MIEHLLNRSVLVLRPETTGDGGGGQVTTWSPVGTVRGRVSQPTSRERETGDQHGADLTHEVYFAPRADVRRGDRLQVGTDLLEVLATYEPSRPKYLRADCRLRESEGDP